MKVTENRLKDYLLFSVVWQTLSPYIDFHIFI